MRCRPIGFGVAALGAAQSVAAAGTPRAESFRNSCPSLPDDLYRAQLKAAKALACQPALPPGIKFPPGIRLPGLPPVPTAPGKVTFSTAVATAERAAELRGARGRKLRKSPPAALLLAADRNPRDPLLPIDAGKPNEALALLARAETLPQRKLRMFGVPTLGILETNRSAALFRTGQYAAAAAAGRRAPRKRAWLAEARENRGMALLCMNKDEEAICGFREAAKRPLEKGEEHLTCAARVAPPADFGHTVATPGVYPPTPETGPWPTHPDRRLRRVGRPAFAPIGWCGQVLPRSSPGPPRPPTTDRFTAQFLF